MVRYLDNRKVIGVVVEEEKFKQFKRIIGSRKASQAFREYVDDVISQGEIDFKKEVNERFRLYHKIAKSYDQQTIRLFIKSLDNTHDLTRVITNSRALMEEARNRKKELCAYIDKETDDNVKIQTLDEQAQEFEEMFTDLVVKQPKE
jgi:hypothetical protein